MTIVYDPARASALTLSGERNNPIVTGENEAASATITTDIGAEVLPGENATSGATFDTWAASPGGSNLASWRANFGTAVSPSFCAISAHNIADIGGSVRVQYSTDGGVSWNNDPSGLVTPTDNQAIGFRMSGTISASLWRVVISSITETVAIGVIWFGDEIIIPRRIYQGFTPAITPTIVDLVPNFSESGHILGSKAIVRGSSVNARLRYIEPSFLRGATWREFQRRFNNGEGTFFAWRPYKYGDILYGMRSATLTPSNDGPGELMGFTLQMRAYDE